MGTLPPPKTKNFPDDSMEKQVYNIVEQYHEYIHDIVQQYHEYIHDIE